MRSGLGSRSATSLTLALTLVACGAGGARVEAVGARSPACPAGSRRALGACVTQAVADGICGPGAVARDDGCRLRPSCEPGRARELTTGECLPRREARALALEQGIVVGEDDEVVCEESGTGSGSGSGSVLVAAAETGASRRIGCLSPATSSALPGFAPGPDGRVDVVRWLRTAVGTDGGAGADSFCSALARQPGALATQSAVVRVEIALFFPDNDVSQAVARARVTAALAGVTPAEADRELERVMAPRAEALRSLGGTASDGTVSIRVHCERSSSRPRARPQNCTRRGADQC